MDEDQVFISANIDTPTSFMDQFKQDDPFNKNWSEIKTYAGLDNNFKRRPLFIPIS